ncbi:MAG TPA: PDZ domain-containing protein [Sunxiuqinia sp.]|nr:PDZ domain-containing protein [Sunxiuqinia sp.]
MKNILFTVLFVFASMLWQNTNAQINARMFQFPDVSATQIVFYYGGDLWIAPITGGTASKLTNAKGQEILPRFSPDGSQIAFSGNYNGNTDIYVMSSKGGMPFRLTHHGMADLLSDWYPDGKQLLYASSMESGRQRFHQFYAEPAEGGMPSKLPLPYGEFGSISPDGTMIAYTPRTRVFRTWKRYRGGMATDIWLFNLETNESENITNSIANDEMPMWHGRTIYYMSDNGPEERANIWSYNLDTKENKQITYFKNFDIHFPAIGPKDLIFEAGGKLYLLDLATEKYQEVKINVITDESTLVPKLEKVQKYIHNYWPSPDGKRALFQARGEVFSVPAEHGAVIDLTHTSGFAERFPSWSPDGRYIAYWSDRSGEYELTLKDLSNNGLEEKLTSYGPGYRYNIYWSPDSKKMAFIDKAGAIHLYDLQSEKTTEIDRSEHFMPDGALSNFKISWSSDSKWLTYSKKTDNLKSAIYIYDVENQKTHQVTSGYYDDQSPVFDPDGKYLYLLTNRTFKPMYGDVDNSFLYANATNVAAISLTNNIPSPLAARNDTVAISKEVPAKKTKEGKDDKKEKDGAKEQAIKINFDGFENRLVILPPKNGNIANLEAAPGKVIFLRLPNTGSADKKKSAVYYDLKNREEKTIADNISRFQVTANHKKIMIAQKNHSYFITDIAPNQKLEKKMPTDQLSMMINPRKEWHQIFNDAWRFERDFFYDPNMHGVDWQAMRERYGKLIDDCITRWDVNYVIGELIAELNSSHTYKGGGDEQKALRIGVGYLGVNWALNNGAYQIKKIIQGAPWDDEVKSPLAEPGVKIKEGDYVLAVNGNPIDTSKDPWAAFENLSRKTVELTVNNKPGMNGAWTIVVKTMADETRLRNLAWIEANRETVDKETNGKIGYLYIQDTGIEGQTELVKQFSAQHNKDGLIVDERFNSGGQIPDRFMEILNRKPLTFLAVRDWQARQSPAIANSGPKVMLINGWSGSGGDAFPLFFRETGAGPIIGTRTWGGLIGYTGAPNLIDNGMITLPSIRFFSPEGKWFPEGHGVDPDFKVVNDPTSLSNGTDPQLEAGIKKVMELLKTNPPIRPHQPLYENRTVNQK